MWLTKFLWLGTPKDHSSLAATVLKKHFEGVPKSDLLTASRKFPPTARADLQRALEESFTKFGARPLGLHQQFSHSGITFADLLETGHNAVSIGPLQHDELDTGEERAVRCVKTALWLSTSDGVKFAVLVANSDRYSSPETIVEVAVEAGETGSEFSRQLLQDIEKLGEPQLNVPREGDLPRTKFKILWRKRFNSGAQTAFRYARASNSSAKDASVT